MKFLASLLICAIVLLSSFSGTVKPVDAKSETECCKKMDKKHCDNKPEQKPLTKDCEKNGCNMLLTCSICGFLMVEPLRVNTAIVTLVETPVPTYQSGNYAACLPSDWKPPKV